MGTYHCGSAAASKVAPSGRGNLHIDTWNATDPLSQRPPNEKKSSSLGTFNPRPLQESRSPPSMMSSPRKKKSLRLSFPSNQKARFLTS
ncbi:hypothetical protein AVEN_267375-1 [Araneus ventricosus]|uniref:Uncharacterized protein n=1 Tax=Araneus ventricosus TaxID=182803 RepID=A0A4Y2X043_ARAVE|nr:hypothetical protein AVEN_267375-1 [Araneus ventricosus]